jgi:hypothetical protein
MPRRLLEPRLLGPILVVATFAIGALWFYVPHLTEDHPVVLSTPTLVGYQSSKEVVLHRGQQACTSPVPLEPGLRTVRMVLHGRGKQASPLELELRGPGYRGAGRFSGYPSGGIIGVQAAVSPAPPRDADGVLCVRNPGRHSVGLVGTDEPISQSLAATSVDGKPAGPVDPAITFLGGPPRSMISYAGTILGRASDLTGGFVPLWLLWPLALVFVLGAPLALAWALYTSLEPE